MNSVELSKNSWHYKLATKFGDYYWYSSTSNICAYVREVIKGFFILLGVGGLALMGVVAIVTTLYWLIMHGFHFLNAPPFVIASAGLTSIVSLGTGLGLGISKIIEYQDMKRQANRANPPQPSFLKLAYRSFKDKMCFKISFKE